jgi:hypothetical protein
MSNVQRPLVVFAALAVALAVAAPTPDILSYDAAFDFTWTIWDVVDTVANTSTLHVLPPNATWVNQTCVGLVVFNASMYDQGWDYLQVVPNSSTVNMSNYYVGGFGEGYVTHDRIDFVYDSMGIYDLSPKAQAWVNEHIAYMELQSSLQNSSFWVQVSNLLALMQGIADGYSARAEELGTRKLNFTQIFYLNFNIEYPDVETAVNDELNEGVHFRSTEKFREQMNKRQYRDQHCSALIKVTADDLFVSHDTWDIFENTIRMFKTYVMPEATVAYSGMAGLIASGDDWYITSNNLAVQETTNEVFNTTLYKLYTVPTTVSEFLRAMVATYLATTGQEWVELFQYNNSGTYCNQWMVVNYNNYQAGQTGDALSDGLLWVAEQIPGNVTSGDMTAFLVNFSYWPSYNTPFFPNIYELSGYPQMEAEYGPFFSYDNYSRAEIFRRNQSDVVDIASMQALMRFNDWKVDPLTVIPRCPSCNPTGSPMLGIASRGDQVPVDAVLPPAQAYAQFFGRNAFGAIDCKITSSVLIAQLQGVVQSGPTTYNGNPVFSWTGPWAGQNPAGAPLSYNFSWQYYNVITPPPPPHGYFSGLSHTATVVLAAVGGTLGVSVVVGGVVLLLKKRHSDDDYQPLS